VFGSHRKPKSPFHWMLYTVPPLLVVLTLLPGWVGTTWRVIAAAIGVYWIIDRARINARPVKLVAGTRTLEPERVLIAKPAFYNVVYELEITKHEVALERLPRAFDGYRIAFLPDTHVAPFMRRELYREAVARVLAFEPDLILFGGDFGTWERHIPFMAEVLLPELRARDGVYAVLGNHDYWANAPRVVAALRGVRFLTNDSIAITRGADAIHLIGLDELYRGNLDVPAAFANVDASRVCIGLSHHPDLVEYLEGHRLDLLVCGHTHGGQIRFPFFGSVVVPSRHEARYASGFHRTDEVLLYVSRGIGAVPPVRVLCRPEVATFVLRCP
ncbi:MAG: metallophosphoesterase, partial [Thermoanaerobaculia bacterium]